MSLKNDDRHDHCAVEYLDIVIRQRVFVEVNGNTTSSWLIFDNGISSVPSASSSVQYVLLYLSDII
jgi:hypothetical protein